MVYTVFVKGETVTVIGVDEPENIVPSDKVPFQGPLPVTAILKLVDAPEQIEAAPLIFPVGLGTTVMVTVSAFEQPPTVTVPVTV